MTNEQFDILDRHLGSIALSLKEIATHLGELPLPTANAKASGSSSSHTGWRAVVIPFGKQKGEALGDIGEKSLAWWIENYQPKGFTGRDGNERPPSSTDLALRKALDEAAAETGGKPAPAEGSRPSAPANPPPPRRPAPAPQPDINDEDVPF